MKGVGCGVDCSKWKTVDIQDASPGLSSIRGSSLGEVGSLVIEHKRDLFEGGNFGEAFVLAAYHTS